MGEVELKINCKEIIKKGLKSVLKSAVKKGYKELDKENNVFITQKDRTKLVDATVDLLLHGPKGPDKEEKEPTFKSKEEKKNRWHIEVKGKPNNILDLLKGKKPKDELRLTVKYTWHF